METPSEHNRPTLVTVAFAGLPAWLGAGARCRVGKWAGALAIAFLAAAVPVLAQDQAPPPAGAPAPSVSPNPSGSQPLLTPIEPLDQSQGPVPGDSGENLVTPLQLDQMLEEFDLPPSSGEPGAQVDGDGNPLFSNVPIDTATAERAQAMAALLKGNTQVGPFGLTGPFLGLQTGVAITGMYDSNILQTSEELSQEVYGQGPESFVMRFSPFARYRSPGSLWLMEAGYSPSYVMYTDFSDLDGWEHNADIALRYDIREWEAQIAAYYRKTITGNLNQMARNEASATVGGTADGSFDRDGLGGEDFGARLSGGYTGQRLEAILGAGYGLSDGQNRYYGSEVREERYDANLRIAYKLTPKTRLQLDGGYSFRGPLAEDIEVEPAEPPPPPPPIYVNSLGQVVPPPPGTVVPEPVPVEEEEETPVVQNYDETTTARMNMAALWSVSPLLELGPGIRATYDARSDNLSSNSFGPLIRARYQLSRNVSLSAQVAAEFHQFEEREVEPVAPPPPPPQPQIIVVPDPVVAGPTPPVVTPAPVVQPAPVVTAPEPEPEPTYDEADSPFISAEIGGVWSPTDEWSIRLALARSSRISSGTEDDFREVFSTRATVVRAFSRGNISLSGGYEVESPMREQIGATTSMDREYITVDLSYSFPVWKDRAFATTFVRYRSDQSGTADNSWDGYQAGLAVAVSF